MSAGYIVETLGAHDRKTFDCGAVALDIYLRERAGQDAKRLIASCFVMVEHSTSAVAGYYTLSASSVPANELPLHILTRLPRYPVLPAALVGRLAVDRRFQGRGLASALLADATKRALRGDVKTFAIIVDAKDESAAAFYRRHGFRPFVSRPMSLFLPLGTAKKAATEG